MYCLLPEPPNFSLPSTFNKTIFSRYIPQPFETHSMKTEINVRVSQQEPWANLRSAPAQAELFHSSMFKAWTFEQFPLLKQTF
jgi:hypothetical protein